VGTNAYEKVKWVVQEGFISESPMVKVKVAKPKRKVIKPYTLGQVERMLAVDAFVVGCGEGATALRLVGEEIAFDQGPERCPR